MRPTNPASYVRQLDCELRKRFVVDARLLDEIRDHLIDASDRKRQRGYSLASADEEAIEQFGPPDIVAEAFAADRSRVLHRCLFVLATMAGFAIAYVDSRPTWDDTGITAAAMVPVAGLLGFVGPRRAWVWALAVGSWIPAYAVARSPSPGTLGMVIVLVFPAMGAYAGVALRHVARTLA